MPYVNIKYQLTLDDTVHIDANHFYLLGIPLKPGDTTGKDNLPTNRFYVADTVTIDMLLSGAAGSWTIAVYVKKLDPFECTQIGEWIPLLFNGTRYFTDDISNDNSLLGDFKINWP